MKETSEDTQQTLRAPQTPLRALSLTAAIVLLDQVTKAIIVARIPLYQIGTEWFGGLVRIIHTRNPAVAFSIGYGIPEPWRGIVFTVLPLLVLVGVGLYYWRSSDLTNTQTWLLAGVLGGGVGNLIDRFIRPEGVVDFVDVAFFGIFGLDRWPTFNVADAAVVVSGIAFVLAVIIVEARTRGRGEEKT